MNNILGRATQEPTKEEVDAGLDEAEALLRKLAWSNNQDGKIRAAAWRAMYRIAELRKVVALPEAIMADGPQRRSRGAAGDREP